jgi:hypothetical protein
VPVEPEGPPGTVALSLALSLSESLVRPLWSATSSAIAGLLRKVEFKLTSLAIMGPNLGVSLCPSGVLTALQPARLVPDFSKSGTGTGEHPRFRTNRGRGRGSVDPRPRANRGRRSRPRPRANRERGRGRGRGCPRPARESRRFHTCIKGARPC